MNGSVRHVCFDAFGAPEVLRLVQAPRREPGPGEVRIRVGAFGLNRVEALYRAGQFGPVSFPARIGYEAAGVIEALGPGAEECWSLGDRVATLFGLSMERWGTHGESVIYPADMLVPVGSAQSLVDAAASWMQYGTAFAVVECAEIGPGDSVAITAASSSVGIAAIQIARDHGARPIAITRTRDKAAALQALGAAEVIVSDEEPIAARLLDLTGGVGPRVVFDAVGGPALSALVEAMAPHGMAIVYGMLGGHVADVALPALMLGNRTLRGFSADALVRDPAARKRLTGYLGEALAIGRLRPVIDSRFDLAEIVAAHRHLESNRQLGKIVVTTGTSEE